MNILHPYYLEKKSKGKSNQRQQRTLQNSEDECLDDQNKPPNQLSLEAHLRLFLKTKSNEKGADFYCFLKSLFDLLN